MINRQELADKVCSALGSPRCAKQARAAIEALPWGTFAGEYKKNDPYKPIAAVKAKENITRELEKWAARRQAVYCDRQSGMTFAALGRKYGVGKQQASNIVKKVERVIKARETKKNISDHPLFEQAFEAAKIVRQYAGSDDGEDEVRERVIRNIWGLCGYPKTSGAIDAAYEAFLLQMEEDQTLIKQLKSGVKASSLTNRTSFHV